MQAQQLTQLFSLQDRVAIVTGGTGVLGGAMARASRGNRQRLPFWGAKAEAGRNVAARWKPTAAPPWHSADVLDAFTS
ncbi:MAG: hypothetical protein R2932_46155 [Caldilineaceae bacterium]